LVANKPVGRGKVISLAGVTVAPLSTLEPAQVALETERTKEDWVVIARRGEKWVRVFSGEGVFVGDGDIAGEGAIGAPCFFPYKGELVVPVRRVAEALGLKMEQKGQMIALLAR
jgi:hypothetical protein